VSARSPTASRPGALNENWRRCSAAGRSRNSARASAPSPWSSASRRAGATPPSRIAQLPVTTDSGRVVPLSALADVREAKGPNVILRENAAPVHHRDQADRSRRRRPGGRAPRERCARAVPLPEGYFITYEGEFQAQQEATRRIALFGGLVFVVIALLLYGYFRSLTLALQVMLNIPLALVGGLVFTWLEVGNISIATLVGFIAVGGVAARNGIMMLSHYLHLMRHEGEGFTRAMVERGTLERMVPVLMTALAAGIALDSVRPRGDEPGKEILHPVAVVIVGGLVSSTLLDFLVRPLVFFHFGRRAALRALARDASASS
jgi:Cu/Ag efflux pump CusA